MIDSLVYFNEWGREQDTGFGREPLIPCVVPIMFTLQLPYEFAAL